MRLRCSGDRHEIRQQYIPLLWARLIKDLALKGKDAISNTVKLMDSYFLTREDFDAIMELGVGPMNQDGVRIETHVKSAFTKTYVLFCLRCSRYHSPIIVVNPFSRYNSQPHPLPFMKASNVSVPKKLAKEKPDLEEAVEESDDADTLEDNHNEDIEDLDLSKDKYVKQPKKRSAHREKAKGYVQEDNVETDRQDDNIADERRKGKAKSKAKSKGM